MAANTKRDRSENDSRACATHETAALSAYFRFSSTSSQSSENNKLYSIINSTTGSTAH